MPPTQDATFRILVLGAGFSRLAGLPLGTELFQLVRRSVATAHGRTNRLERDIARYIQYRRNCDDCALTPDSIDYEEFLGFLDIEHFLWLRGGDTWSSEGNESQLMIRQAIGRVLLDRTPSGRDLPQAYRRFARGLTSTDWVLTFNYDTLLETALEAEGVRYRLFPHRYSRIHAAHNDIDSSEEEVVVLKLHGSLDWFHRAGYEEQLAVAASSGIQYEPRHPVFGRDRIVDATPIVGGPRSEQDPLLKVFRVGDARRVYDSADWRYAPLLLAPSSMKLVYSQPLHSLWWGLARAGGLCLSVGIIGYSLPPYDAYARQALYALARNFTEYEPDLRLGTRRKTKLRIVDLCGDQAARGTLADRYRFVNWERGELWSGGFDEEAVEWLLRGAD